VNSEFQHSVFKMDRRQSQVCLQVTNSLNFGIDRILNTNNDLGKY